MTTTKNRNAARSVAVAATMFLGLSVSTAFAQEAQSVDPAEISAMTADFTLATTAFLADEIAQREMKPELVLASPYPRARETAEPIWEALGMNAQIDDRLGADRSLSDMLDVLMDARGSSCVAIVSHNPNCARIVSTLCNGLTTMPAGHRTGELAHVIVEDQELIGNGELLERMRMGD